VDHSTAKIFRKQVIARMGDRQRVERSHSDGKPAHRSLSRSVASAAAWWKSCTQPRRAIYKPLIIVPRHPRCLKQHRDERFARWSVGCKLLRAPHMGVNSGRGPGASSRSSS
jgi:hypothetical protein